MSNSSQLFYLKDGLVYKVAHGNPHEASLQDVIDCKGNAELIIDDKYFYYVGMENISVSGKKLNFVVSNYLSTMFPADSVKTFGIYQGNGATLIFILSNELIKIIEENQPLFSACKKISSAFIEFVSIYQDVTFSDSERLYKKEATVIKSASAKETNYIGVKDFFNEYSSLKNNINLPGIKKAKFSKMPLALPLGTLLICYLMFLTAGIFKINSEAKLGEYYEEKLNELYKTAGVAETQDPYGILVAKSKQFGDGNYGKRILTTLIEIADIKEKGAQLSAISIRDKSVRIEGIAEDFAKVEELKALMNQKLKKQVSMDETKKTDKGITFVMRYEY